jgi:hypothetical protein
MKFILDGLDKDVLIHLTQSFTYQEISDFVDTLPRDVVRTLTRDQWSAMVYIFDSERFMEILEDATNHYENKLEEMRNIFSFLDKRLISKFYDGLTMEDIEEFTTSEWKLAFELPPDEFKRRFLDHMTFE